MDKAYKTAYATMNFTVESNTHSIMARLNSLRKGSKLR